ncbi:MAG TPA: NAD-dependent epimerase/dehydratase family protein [candidate division Zixibacteria bacterium]|nr:NAD-dependent epimerase/dehydratase family protein [candidate division Zixibacteria bacterium]
MNVLVTGASGFLGVHLVKELVEKNYPVKALIRPSSRTNKLDKIPEISFFKGDLIDKKSLVGILKDIDILFHNASAVGEWGSYRYFKKNNVGGTKNLLELVLNSSVEKIIYTSTADIYRNSNKPLTEETSLHPRGNYHKTKIEAEKLLDIYADKHGLNISKIRPPGILGPGNSYMAERIIRGVSQSEVTVIGSGNQIQSYVDVRDVATILRIAAEKNEAIGKTFNVTSSNATVKDYWNTAAKIINKSITFRHYPYKIAYGFGAISEFIAKVTFRKETPKATRFRVSYFGENHIIDDSKAKKILNFKPQFNFFTSMFDMLDDFLTNVNK